MGGVVVYERTLLGPNARLVVHRLALVSVVIGSLSIRMAAWQSARGIVHRVLAGKLALDVAGHSVGMVWRDICSHRQSAGHHGRSCLGRKLRKAVGAKLATGGALGG